MFSCELFIKGVRFAKVFKSIIYKGKDKFMNMHISIGPLLALISGIIILVFPKLLNYIVAIYLIIVGLLGLFGAGHINL